MFAELFVTIFAGLFILIMILFGIATIIVWFVDFILPVYKRGKDRYDEMKRCCGDHHLIKWMGIHNNEPVALIKHKKYGKRDTKRVRQYRHRRHSR